MTNDTETFKKLTEDEFYDYLENRGTVELYLKSYYKGVAAFENDNVGITASMGHATYEDAYNLSFEATELLSDAFVWVKDNDLKVEYLAPERW